MNDSFGLAAFRSRTQVLRMEDALHRAGLSAGVIATPREVAIGCGLSVRFDLAQTPQVMQVYRRLNPGALIGFYRVEGYVSANLARKTTGFSEDDLKLLWEAILNMFENDHSAARGKMAVRELIVFKHDTELGCAPAHKLFDLVKAVRKEGVTAPRDYEDYTVTVVEDELPDGVTCTRMG